MTKKYYLVIDTETVADARIPYDIAYTIIDRKGNIIEQADYIVSEIITNPTMRYLLEKDSFAKSKADFYLNGDNGIVRPFEVVRAMVNDAVERYNATVVAYNAAFDMRVLKNYSISLLDKPFWDNEPQVWDLWGMTLNTLCDSGNYVHFCIENGFITGSGNIKCSAESVYAYISDNAAFEEDHTALSDTEIEARILVAVFKTKKKLTPQMVGFVSNNKVWKKRLNTRAF